MCPISSGTSQLPPLPIFLSLLLGDSPPACPLEGGCHSPWISAVGSRDYKKWPSPVRVWAIWPRKRCLWEGCWHVCGLPEVRVLSTCGSWQLDSLSEWGLWTPRRSGLSPNFRTFGHYALKVGFHFCANSFYSFVHLGTTGLAHHRDFTVCPIRQHDKSIQIPAGGFYSGSAKTSNLYFIYLISYIIFHIFSFWGSFVPDSHSSIYMKFALRWHVPDIYGTISPYSAFWLLFLGWTCLGIFLKCSTEI